MRTLLGLGLISWLYADRLIRSLSETQILLAFTVSAALTVLDEVVIAFLIESRNERALKALRIVLINRSDQQLITSLSLVIALVYRLR